MEKDAITGYVHRGNLEFQDYSLKVIRNYDNELNSVDDLRKALKKLKGDETFHPYVISADTALLMSNSHLAIHKDLIKRMIPLSATRDSLENIKSEMEKKNGLFDDVLPIVERKDSLSVKYKNSKFKNAIIDKKIKIGMTKKMVLDSWGAPNDIHRTVGSWGVHEQWVYDNQYLYLENDILTSFQD